MYFTGALCIRNNKVNILTANTGLSATPNEVSGKTPNLGSHKILQTII